MNANTAMETIATLEPYARRLLAMAERRGPAYERHWGLALQQARLVVRAYDEPPCEVTSEIRSRGGEDGRQPG